MKHAFFSTLTTADCIQTFIDNVGEDRVAFPYVSRPFFGRVRGHRFRLRARRVHRNPFAPVFYGTFRELPGGTLIEGHVRIHPLVRLFAVLWLAFPGVFLCGFACAIGRGLIPILVGAENSSIQIAGDELAEFIRGALVLLGFALLGVGMILFGKFLGRTEEEAILQFLQDTLDARPADPGERADARSSQPGSPVNS